MSYYTEYRWYHIVAIIAGSCLIIGGIVWAMVEAVEADRRERAAWAKYVIDNECKVVEKIQGETKPYTSYSYNSITRRSEPHTSYRRTPDRSVWVCNDGLRVTRDDD